MAITTTTISKAAGWARTDIILQLEEAFSWLGFHGTTQTGWVSGITTYSGGGTVGSAYTDYYDVFPISTTGIGTGASFYVDRSNGPISRVYVNRPGYGYTGGEIVTLSAEDIGGASNGATNLTVKVAVAGTVTGAVGYAISFVNGSDYVASGTDRNGAVSGANTTITIREGDTLTFTNYNNFSGYNVNICWRDETTANDANRVFNVINQNAPNGGGICTWTPSPGQAGTYFIKDDNYSISGVSTIRIVVTSANSANINYTGVGSTTSFYDKQITAGATYPWGVLRHEIQPNKKFGSTYRGFQVVSDTSIKFHVGSGFHPTNETTLQSNSQYAYNLYNCGAFYPNRFAGNAWFDMPYTPVSSAVYFKDTADDHGTTNQLSFTFASTTSYQLDLNIFRSSIDPRFAVLSYKHPTLSSTKLRDNTFATFILHNFTTDIWDLNQLFLGGVTSVTPNSNDNDPYLSFISTLAGENYAVYYYSSNSGFSKRCAESGYLQYGNVSDSYQIGSFSKETRYRPNSYPSASDHTFNTGIYLRNNSTSSHRSIGGPSDNREYLPSSTNYNAVIKGLPLSAHLAPCPYYLPDDFVLIDFDYATPSTNIQQGDTITISGSEVYTVITGSYNQTTRTRGILFCARTV